MGWEEEQKGVRSGHSVDGYVFVEERYLSESLL